MANRIEKNISQIFENTYKIPLYQRNFAWEGTEVEKLLQDIYLSFITNRKSNYFVGSLTTLKRRNGEYEVIDGQQRLTVLSLITRILNNHEESSLFKVQKLFYDSRPEVDSFLNNFYKDPDFVDKENSPLTFRFKDAVDTIYDTKLDTRGFDNNACIENKEWKEFVNFKKYFEENVILVCVEIPEDTDVASYFEIMNNRGAQLQDHEIIKARLMSKIKSKDGSGFDLDKQRLFALVWDACSQMDCHVQENFNAPLRRKLFSTNYDSFKWDVDEAIEGMNEELDEQDVVGSDSFNEPKSINDLIDDDKLYRKYLSEALEEESDNHKENEDSEEIKFYSIIDFPNFLMHVFKTYYETEESISLHDKYLIMTYNLLEKKGLLSDPMDFVKKLLWCRTVFDRYVVKTTDPILMDWSLKHAYLSGKGLKYGLTFGKCEKKKNFDAEQESETDDNKNDICVKILSMLQVTFRSKYYKNYLFYIFKYFSEKDNLKISADEYISFLNFVLLFRFGLLKSKNPNWKSMGEKTPHYALNYIDYLYWYKSICENNELSGTDYSKIKLNSFVFRNLNSVEHHLARNLAIRLDKSKGTTKYSSCVNNLGNLYLLGKNDNSRLNDRPVKDKIMDFFDGNNFKDQLNLGPNRQLMYRISNSIGWTDIQINNHHKEIIQMMENSYKLFGISEADVNSWAKELNILNLD